MEYKREQIYGLVDREIDAGMQNGTNLTDGGHGRCHLLAIGGGTRPAAGAKPPRPNLSRTAPATLTAR